MIFPSTCGVIPIFDSFNAFSMSFTVAASNGCTTSRRGSGVVMSASCFNFMAEPYASTSTFSTSAGDAFPVRTLENSCTM